MRGINKVTVLGYVGKAPLIKELSPENKIAEFSVATKEVWKDKKTGTSQTDTEWHSIKVFGRLANVIEKYVKSGDPIYLEGFSKTESWNDKKDGEPRYKKFVYVSLSKRGVLELLPNSTSSQPSQFDQSNPLSDEQKFMDAFDDDIPL